MSIILDEEKISHLFRKILSYEDDNKIAKFKDSLLLIEDAIKKYSCPGSNSFLCCVYTNTWKNFISYLRDNHQAILERIIKSKILDSAKTHSQEIQNSKNNPDCWVLNSIVGTKPFSSTVEFIDTILELANETLFCPISENKWVEDIIISNGKIKVCLSHFLADINPYNLEGLFEL